MQTSARRTDPAESCARANVQDGSSVGDSTSIVVRRRHAGRVRPTERPLLARRAGCDVRQRKFRAAICLYSETLRIDARAASAVRSLSLWWSIWPAQISFLPWRLSVLTEAAARSNSRSGTSSRDDHSPGGVAKAARIEERDPRLFENVVDAESTIEAAVEPEIAC